MNISKTSLFVKNFPLEASEDVLASFFSQYGKVKRCTIPRDHKTNRCKGYSFVKFHFEEDARKAQQACNNMNYLGKLLIVTFANEKSRSRSRTPSRSPKSDKEDQAEINFMRKTHDDLKSKNSEIMQDCEKLRKEERDLLDQRKLLKNELNMLKSKKNIFLPCGHSKLIDMQEYNISEELISHASQHLSAKESENSNIVKQLKAKVIGIMANKFPESFRCKEMVKIIIGKCGHVFSCECCMLVIYKKGEKMLECTKLVDRLLPCGHNQLIECYKELDIVICKQC